MPGYYIRDRRTGALSHGPGAELIRMFHLLTGGNEIVHRRGDGTVNIVSR